MSGIDSQNRHKEQGDTQREQRHPSWQYRGQEMGILQVKKQLFCVGSSHFSFTEKGNIIIFAFDFYSYTIVGRMCY